MNNFKENIRSERTCRELGKKKKKRLYSKGKCILETVRILEKVKFPEEK